VATFVIGDIQGCWDPLQRLLATIPYDPGRDRLWLVGDLVNRGPGSLEVLRWARGLGDGTVVVLGNHDLHLIGRALGSTTRRPGDTLDAVLGAPDREELLSWLRSRPFAHREDRWLLVHAGLLPEWTVEEALQRARELEQVVAGPDAAQLLARLHARRAPRPEAASNGRARRELALAALVRMRCVDTRTGELALRFKGPPEEAPDGLIAWFDAATPRDCAVTVVCGHWSALGLRLRPGLVATDTGCWMGRELTAVRLEDLSVFQVPAFSRGGGRRPRS